MRQATATERATAPAGPPPPGRRPSVGVLVVAVVAVVAAMVALVVRAVVDDPDDAPEATGDADTAAEAPPAGAFEGTLRWQATVADGSLPAVVGDDAVLTGQDARAVAGERATVQSFDAVTGRENWDVELGSPVAVPVGIAGRVAVVAGDGSLAGLHLEEGVTQWQFTAGPTPGPAVTLLPVGVASDRVVVGGETLTSLEPTSGEARWDVAVTTEQLTIDDDLVLAAGDGQVHAVAVETGAIEWTHDLGNGAGFAAPPIAVDGAVVAASGLGDVVVIDRDSGELRYQVLLDELEDIPDDDATAEGAADATRLDRAVSLGADPGDGFVVVGGESGTLYGFDTDDGDRLWDRVVTADLALDGAVTVHAGRDLVVVGGPGSRDVAAYRLDTGLQEWNYDLAGEGDADVAPFVRGDLVFAVAASVDGRDLVALDLEGAEQWRVGLASDVIAPLLASDDLVLAVSEQADPDEAPVLFAVG